MMTVILVSYIIVFPFENFSEIWLLDDYRFIYVNILFELYFIVDIILNFFVQIRDK